MTDREKMICAIERAKRQSEEYAQDHILVPFREADMIISLLREQEPVIVRCKDCKYWNAGTCLNDRVSWQIEDCGCYPDFHTDSDWFCAEGERR